MSTQLHITLTEYEAMVASGAFDALKKKRIELIHGELREMSPQGPPHHHVIAYLNRWSNSNTSAEQVTVLVQGPIRIPDSDSEPEPDIAWVVPATEPERHFEPHEVLLIVEVADSSLRFDLGEKAQLYSAAGIADYWVVDLPHRVVHVLRQPTPDGYRQQDRVAIGDSISPLHFPHITLSLADLFPR